MKTKLRTHRYSKRCTLIVLLLFMGIQFATAQVVQLYPGDANLQTTIDEAPAGTTFMFNTGADNEVYRLLSIKAKNGDSYIGVPDANGNLPILNGSDILTNSDFTYDANGGYWYIDNVAEDVAPTASGCQEEGGTSDCCEDGFDCLRAEDIFINGVPQKKVNSLAEMNAEGECFIDGSRVYLKSNPSGKTIELSTKKFAIYAARSFTTDVPAASNVTVKNLIIEQYASPVQHGAIHAGYNSQFDQPEKMGKGWLIENNEVRYNHGAGIFVYTDGIVRDNYVHHNGQIGMRSYGDNILIEENEIAENGNWSGVNSGWEGGGTKFTHSQDIQILNNHSHDNFGPGLWTDIENYNSYYEGNLVENNSGPGIFHEISYSATIKCNTLINNWNSKSGGNLYGGNIFISNSSGVEAFDNVCVSSGGVRENGIIINCAARVKDGVTYYSQNNYIHDNDIIFTADDNYTGALIKNCNNPNDDFSVNGNLFENNRYHSVNTARNHFVWGATGGDTGNLDWMQNTIGQDSGSTIDSNLTIPDTPCNTPCTPFTQFTVGTVTSQSIALNWQQTNDDIQVLWRLESDITSWQNENVATNSYTITGLTPDTQYRITLKNLCDNSTTSPQNVTTPAPYYYITNRQTGDRFYPESTAHNAPLLKADEGRNDDWVQWEKIPTSGNYFYLKNKATGKYIRPKNDDNAVTVWQVPTTYTGSYTQWEEIPVNNSGFYHLKNRATGKYFRPQTDTPNAPIQQQPNTWTGSWTQWTIEPVNAAKLQTAPLTFNLYPNPADDYIRIETQHISENSTVNIYDISGKLVIHQAVDTDTFDVSVQALTAGMYIARLDIGDGTYAAQRFVVR